MGRGATFNGIMELPLSFALRALFFLFNLASLSLSLSLYSSQPVFLSLLVYATGQIRVEKCIHMDSKEDSHSFPTGQFDRESSSFVPTHFLLLPPLRLDFSLNAFHSFPRLYVTWHENETFFFFFLILRSTEITFCVYLQKYFLFSYYYYYYFLMFLFFCLKEFIAKIVKAVSRNRTRMEIIFFCNLNRRNFKSELDICIFSVL